MHAVINKSGTGVFHGNMAALISMFLEPGDARHGEHFVQVPVFPPEGYTGPKDNEDAYKAWVKSLPKRWQNNPFHNHYIYGDPDITDAEIKAQMEFHLANFYRAWSEHKSIRSGWATETRIRPLRYDEVEAPANFALRKAQCEQRANALKLSNLSVTSLNGGSVFPATDITIGAAATDRTSVFGSDYTLICLNNPANDTGTITDFEVWAKTTMLNTKVGTFFGSGTDYTSRDFELVGTVTAGSKQTFSGLDIDVQTGDFAGCYYSSGQIETDLSGGADVYNRTSDQFGTGLKTYSRNIADVISLFGTGATPVSAPTVTTQAVNGIGFD